MTDIDKLVQLITDRLLQNLPEQSNDSSLLVIGHSETKTILLNEGYVLTEELELANHLVIDYLSLDSLLRIIALCPQSKEETQIITALLRGKSVLVNSKILNFELYKETTRPLLYRKLLQQRETLLSYGVVFYTEDTLLSLLANKPKEKVDLTASKKLTGSERSVSSSSKSRLITEGKLKTLDLKAGDVFTIEPGMIVTALAKDYLKRHKIHIR